MIVLYSFFYIYILHNHTQMLKVFILLCLTVYTSCALDVEHQGTSIQVLGQSGKAKITRGANSVQFQVDYISEMDVSGTEVGKQGALEQKHGVNSMATQEFTFTNIIDKIYKNVSTKEFSFDSSVNAIGKIKVVVMIMDEDSTVGTETETWKVSAGDIKFNIELFDWSFCNPCADGVGEYIDVGVEIKGSKQETIANQTIDLGGAIMELSNRIVVDGVEVNMPDGYPKTVTKGSKQLFMFRFPKFNVHALYDPVLQLSDTSSSSSIQYSINVVWVFISLVILLV